MRVTHVRDSGHRHMTWLLKNNLHEFLLCKEQTHNSVSSASWLPAIGAITAPRHCMLHTEQTVIPVCNQLRHWTHHIFYIVTCPHTEVNAYFSNADFTLNLSDLLQRLCIMCPLHFYSTLRTIYYVANVSCIPIFRISWMYCLHKFHEQNSIIISLYSLTCASLLNAKSALFTFWNELEVLSVLFHELQ